MSPQIQSIVEQYVERISRDSMSAFELEGILTEFAGKIEAQNDKFRADVKAMREKQNAYFAERKAHGFTPVASQLLTESRVLEKKVDAQLSDQPSLF